MSTRRKETREWEPWFNFADDGTTIECVFCANTFQYKRERAFNHYGFKSKSTKYVCRKAPSAVKTRFANCGGVVPARMSILETWGTSRAPSTSVGTHSSAHSTHGNVPDGCDTEPPTPVSEPSETRPGGSRVASCTIRSSSLRQQQMITALHLAKRKELDDKWAAFFYDANVAFNVAKNPTFIEAVKATSQAGFLYEPPKYHALRTPLLDARKKHVEDEVKKTTKYSIETYGATISTDGWDNVVRRPLMNVMLCCPAGDIFLGSVDTSGNKKTRQYIAGELKKYIDQVGPHLVTQVCTDNAANMLGAMDDIVNAYPHMTKQGCTAHALDLFMEDWAKVPQFKTLILKARRVCLYIRNHHVPMALFREASKLQLLMPADTRFACNLLMIQRLIEVRPALEQVVRDPIFMDYVATLFNRQHGHRARALAGVVVATIEDPVFWHQCVNYEQMLKDIIIGLRLFDGREPAMGRVWLAMNNMKKHIFALRDNPFYVPPGIAKHLEDSFMKRWAMVRTDLHLAGALLNPYLSDVVEIQQNGDFKRALNRVVRKLSPILGVNFNDVMVELTDYEERQGPYSPLETPDIREVNLQPHQWWHRVGDKALSKIASRILSLTCSASSCERNWSNYSFVHNKSRNRLGTKKAEALVYIYANSRLLRQRAVANPIRWYDNNILSEESDPSGDDGSDSEYDSDDDQVGNDDIGNDLENEINDDSNDRTNANGPSEDGGGSRLEVFDWEGLDAEDHVSQERERNASTPHNEYHGISDHSTECYDDVRDDDDDGDDYIGNRDDEGHHVGFGEEDLNTNIAIVAEENNNANRENDEDQNPPVEGHDNNPVDEGHVVGNDTMSIGGTEPRDDDGLEDHASRSVNIYGPSDIIPAVEETAFSVDCALVANEPQRPRSVGSTLLNLINTSERTSSKPPVHRGSSMDHENITSPRTTSIRAQPHKRGLKRSSSEIIPFLDTSARDGTMSMPIIGIPGGPQVGSDAEDPLAKRRKRLVRTNVGGEDTIELRNDNSEIEGLVRTNYGDEDDVLGDGDDEREDDDCDEAPCDDDVVVRSLSVPLDGPIRRSSRRKDTTQ